jgi:hypothetical protein
MMDNENVQRPSRPLAPVLNSQLFKMPDPVIQKKYINTEAKYGAIFTAVTRIKTNERLIATSIVMKTFI